MVFILIATTLNPATSMPTTIHSTTTARAIFSVGQKLFVPCYLVTFPLPEVTHLPEELVIISSLAPNDVTPMISNITETSSQHTLRFCDLSTGVEYSYTIRIALRSDTNIDVVDPLTGTFTISKCMGVY